MGHSIGDGIIVVAVTLGILGYLYLRFQERRRRLEVLHTERVMAMEKGIPLPELPLEPPTRGQMQADLHTTLIIGIVLAMFGTGAMAALLMVEQFRPAWPLPLPVSFIGVGLVLYYYLVGRERSAQSIDRRGK